MIVRMARVERERPGAPCEFLPARSEPRGRTQVPESALCGGSDRLLQQLPGLAQGFVVTKHVVPGAFGRLDVPAENAQRRQGLVGWIFAGQALASLQSG